MSEDFYLPDDDQPSYGYFTDEAVQNKGKKIRLWIIGILALIAFIIFIADRYVTVLKPKLDDVTKQRSSESFLKMEDEIRLLFENYGLKPSWITTQDVTAPSAGKIRTVWFIKMPRDVPMASVTHDLKKIAQDHEGSAYAVEDTKVHEITVHVSMNRLVVFSLVFQRDDNVRRESGLIAIFIDGIENAPGAEIEKYLLMREPIACVIQAQRESRKMYSRLVEAKKEIILHIHLLPKKVSESKFELSEDLTKGTVSSRIKNILQEFPGARAFYITSERAIGNAISVTEKDLLKARMIEIPTADIQYVDRGTEFSQMSSRMNDVASIAVKDGHAIGVLELRENTFSFLSDEMIRLQKRGFDFVPVARILSNQGEK